MIIVVQLAGILFAFAMMYFALLHFRRGELNKTEILSWFLIWVAAIFIVVFPDILRVFAKTFLFARLFDLVVLSGVLLSIVMVAKSYVSVKKMERKIVKMISKEAIANAKKTKAR